MKRFIALCAALIAVASFSVQADQLPWKEGPVSSIDSIKIKPGKFDEYMAYLAGPWRELQEARKKAGYISGYAIYSAFPRSPKDADLYLVVAYPNMAALDNSEEKEAPLIDKVFGSRKKSNEKFAARETMREILGTELVRELVLK